MGTMAFCDDHWTRLRTAIDERGLSDLVSDNGAVAASRQLDELDDGMLDGTIDWPSFDPLMFAFWNLLANGSRIVGIPLVLLDDCPLCWLIIEHDRVCDGDPRCKGSAGFEEWIDKAADSAQAEWHRRTKSEIGT